MSQPVKYHESTNGDVVQCYANVKECPLGASAFHGASKEEVYAQIEAANTSKKIPGANPAAIQESVKEKKAELAAATDYLRELQKSNATPGTIRRAQSEVDRIRMSYDQARVMAGTKQYRPEGFRSFPAVSPKMSYEVTWKRTFGEAEKFEREHGVLPSRVDDILRADETWNKLMDNGAKVETVIEDSLHPGVLVAKLSFPNAMSAETSHALRDADETFDREHNDEIVFNHNGLAIRRPGGANYGFIAVQPGSEVDKTLARFNDALKQAGRSFNTEQLKNSDQLHDIRQERISPMSLYGSSKHTSKREKAQQEYEWAQNARKSLDEREKHLKKMAAALGENKPIAHPASIPTPVREGQVGPRTAKRWNDDLAELNNLKKIYGEVSEIIAKNTDPSRIAGLEANRNRVKARAGVIIQQLERTKAEVQDGVKKEALERKKNDERLKTSFQKFRTALWADGADTVVPPMPKNFGMSWK